ncbi:MAG: NAD(+) synthase [Desulfobacterales bacterium]|nr:NAD(+) synthase [Desulfobacterales bacterium]MDX2509896.1 NAD(+) synthase [Desulfobacterales bacterium]
MSKPKFSRDILKIQDMETLIDQLTTRIREDIGTRHNRYGAVIGLSGGIDSSVCMALTAKAIGPEKMLGVMMPEKDSSPDSEELARELAAKFDVKVIKEVITGALDGFGCYTRRDQAVKDIVPEYDPATYKMKIGIKHEGKGSKLPPLFHLTVVKPDGSEIVKRLPSRQMRTIIAASNFKQRSRMSLVYFHAEELHYAVIGTPNKHEVEQGFFVKFGDGGGDLFPIGRLYKTQVYQIAEYLGVPKGIIDRTPTTDTYSAEQTQEDFFYEVPHDIMDLVWYAYENDYDPAVLGELMYMTAEEIERNYRNFERWS